MDRKTISALVLMALVIVVTPLLFPTRKAAPVTRVDTSAAAAAAPTNAAASAATTTPPTATAPTIGAAPPLPPSPSAPATATTLSSSQPAESLHVVSGRAKIAFVNPGAAPAGVVVSGYRNLRPGRRDTTIEIAQRTGPLLRYRLARGADTIALDTVHFTAQTSGPNTTFTAANPPITLTYATGTNAPDNGFHLTVRGTVTNAPPGSTLLIDLPSSFRSSEADTVDDQRHFAYGYKIPLRDPASVPFSKLDAGKVRVDTGSFQWVNARDKYWLVALMQPVGQKPAGIFRGLSMEGGTRVGRVAPTAYATTAYPITNGQIAFDLYLGPQSWNELHALGNELENVNPYASFLHAVVQPFVTIVMRVLLWMKATLRVSYGWVLVLFGIVIRLALWPLNNKAMRTSLAMQRLQPELQELNKRYKNEPEKQREALMKLYQEHGMSPFSPLLGCVPMLIPMPVLYALYFVFQNTIEFRGVPFLWLPDLSLRDPYFITPVVMGLSMFLLSWIGMRGTPSNPQAKMMSYMMPVMFTVFFFNLASGLNLYYAVQNIAALPQQWFIARERAKVGVKPVVQTGTAPATAKRRT